MGRGDRVEETGVFEGAEEEASEEENASFAQSLSLQRLEVMRASK